MFSRCDMKIADAEAEQIILPRINHHYGSRSVTVDQKWRRLPIPENTPYTHVSSESSEVT